MKGRLLILVSLLMVSQSLSFGQDSYYLDETGEDPSFQEFVSKLKVCIQNRDTSLLFPMLADSIYESKDGCGIGTKACFIEYMGFRSDGKGAYFWEESEKAITFGFSKHKNDLDWRLRSPKTIVYQTPSFLKQLPEDDVSKLFVFAERVNVREKPSLQGKIIASVSREILTYNEGMDISGIDWPRPDDFGRIETEKYVWIQVRLKDGRFGYIAERFTSLWTEKELSIMKIRGEWKIISFFHAPGC